MLNIANYFKEGIKKTLLVTNNGATSHNGPWKQAYTNTQVERWHAGEFSAAEFTISIDSNIPQPKYLLKKVIRVMESRVNENEQVQARDIAFLLFLTFLRLYIHLLGLNDLHQPHF